jgi:kinesin family member C1
MRPHPCVHSYPPCSDVALADSIVVTGLQDLYQDLGVGQKRPLYEEVVAEKERLLSAVDSHEKSMAAKEQELSQAQAVLDSTQARLSELLGADMGGGGGDQTHSSTSRSSSSAQDTQIQLQMAELLSERRQRGQLEALLAEERRARAASEARFTAADSEWRALVGEVDLEMQASHRAIETLQETKTTLSREIETLKREASSSGLAIASAASTRELENRLVQSQADTRKAHLLVQQLKGTPGFSLRVFVKVSEPLHAGGAAAPSVVPSQDQVSLQLKEVDGGENLVGRKYIFDKVYTTSSQDKLLDGLDEYIKHAADGKQTSIISYGQTAGNKTELLFGNASGGGSSVVQVAVNRLVTKLKSLETKEGWTYDVKVSFVRILDEDILDLFCEAKDEGAKKKTHEIKRTSDGSTVITNLHAIELDIRDEREVQSVVNHTLVARHVYSDNTGASSLTEWQADCVQSHFVFTVLLRGTHHETGRVVDGKLSFVELAGDDSEDMATTSEGSGSAGSGSSHAPISKSKRSLQCFSDIITSISKRQGHIPYRNTKITYILQPSFSPNGKSILIFGLNRDQSYTSAFKALQFANKVFHCSISPGLSQAGGGAGGGGGGLKHHHAGSGKGGVKPKPKPKPASAAAGASR